MFSRSANSREMAGLRRHFGLFVALVSFVVFAITVNALYERPRPVQTVEMQVALPRFVQVLMAAGDRYLAANLAAFRALVATTETMGPENYRIQGIVQSDAAWLNPAHEDNYYIATAILPWNGEISAAEQVLRLATEARPFDWQPPFYLGFNTLHFLKQPVEAARWLRVAAKHSPDERQAIQLEQLASLWVAKGEDLVLAISISRAMARETKHRAFAAFLEKRAVRLENLLELERAIERYSRRYGTVPHDIRQLVQRGVLKTLPVDPFGMSYSVDPSGKPRPVKSPRDAEIVRGGQ